MTHATTGIAEYAVIINENEEFLMLQLDGKFNHCWHFPGGRLEENEKEIDCLKREIREEMGVEAEILQPVFSRHITQEDYANLRQQRYAVFYLAKIKPGQEIKLNHEHTAYKWFKKEDIEKIPLFMPFYKKVLETLPF